MGKKIKNQTIDIAQKQFERGCEIVNSHPMFHLLYKEICIYREENSSFPQNGWGYITIDGAVYVHPKRRGEPEEWAYIIAHLILHLALGHFDNEYEKNDRTLWNIACDCVTATTLFNLKIGIPPKNMPNNLPSNARDENILFEKLKNNDNRNYLGFSTMEKEQMDMCYEKKNRWYQKTDWKAIFAQALREAISNTISIVGGHNEDENSKRTNASRMKEWFVSSYPLLGAVASSYKLIEDQQICNRQQISIAAVSPEMQEIYINPNKNLSLEELKFVMAHEFLHAGLRHDARCQGRDHYLWNIACDFVINGWLIEMHLGEMPSGSLFDEQFKGLSAESIYDRIVTDIRIYRKLATFKGVGIGDILPVNDKWWEHDGMNLDDFYRNAIIQGLEYHKEKDRGFLPSNLIEEIKALSHPPIPWDVELAQWFDEHFMPLEKTRTYTKLSRRQSSTPDIPRPAYKVEEDKKIGRTYGVILDTSGSMDRQLLANALGAIASYSIARDVTAVRVIFCDAAPYDQGVMNPEDIAGSVKIKGRGGTVLQPAIELLEKDESFPKKAPLLVITDGYCDKLIFYGREHAFLIPQNAHLPFVPKGKIFRICK